MVERFTGEARQVVMCAQEQARRLGHGFIGCEHLLYGLANAPGEAGAVLRERGVTPERYEAQFLRIIGPGNDGTADAALDREALTAIGIDLDTVRERVEAVFGPGALSHPPTRRQGLRRRRRPVTGHLPVTHRVKRCLASSRRQAREQGADRLGAGHIALALLSIDAGLAPRILTALGTSAPSLHAEILDRCGRTAY